MDPSPRCSIRRFPIRDPVVTEIRADPERWFLVVSGTRTRSDRPWTLVLEHQQEYWISRRDLEVPFDPEAAVTGTLFGLGGYPDPVESLRRMNEAVRVEYFGVLQEKIKADRARAELVGELARLKRECEDLQRRLHRKIGRGRSIARRASASPRKPTSSSQRARRDR
jgi:hypothetical protein